MGNSFNESFTTDKFLDVNGSVVDAAIDEETKA